jgi:hypothetical protein
MLASRKLLGSSVSRLQAACCGTASEACVYRVTSLPLHHHCLSTRYTKRSFTVPMQAPRWLSGQVRVSHSFPLFWSVPVLIRHKRVCCATPSSCCLRSDRHPKRALCDWHHHLLPLPRARATTGCRLLALFCLLRVLSLGCWMPSRRNLCECVWIAAFIGSWHLLQHMSVGALSRTPHAACAGAPMV